MDSRLIGLLIIQVWQAVTWSAALKDRAFAENYLRQYQYIHPDDPSEEVGHLVDTDHDEAFIEGLLLFQDFANINPTGLYDDETRKYMHKRRCGMPDVISVRDTVKRKKRYAFQGSRWHQTNITYKIENYPKFDTTQKEVAEIIDKAFRVWSTATLLNFTNLQTDEQADINVRFDTYWHGDQFPFDGYGGSLAHAFFPEYGGDVHFDDNEIWTSGTEHGTNLFQVTVHEIGHSLGLTHSKEKDSLMAAFYKGYMPVFKLHDDDIQAIQILYGVPENNTQVEWTEPAALTPAESAPPCESITFDTVTSHRESGMTLTYAFFGKFYALIDNHGMVPGFPRYIAKDWPGLPSDLDAALYWPPTHEEVKLKDERLLLVEKEPARTYFFKGHLYWRFENKKLLPGYPKPIMYGFRGVPSYLDAAFVWSGNGFTYFIKGNKYYRYIRSRGVYDGYPLPLYVWRGLPSKVDAAFQWAGNKNTYFFTGSQYYKFSDSDFKVHSGYPRTISKWWLDCPGPNQSLRAPNAKPVDKEKQSATTETPKLKHKSGRDSFNGCYNTLPNKLAFYFLLSLQIIVIFL